MNDDIRMPLDTKSNMPCCGVAASAMASGKNFNETWQMIKRIGQKEENWDGPCNLTEMLLPIIENGNMFQNIPIKLGLFGFLNDTFLYWVKRQTKKNAVYLVITYMEDYETHHAQIVYNGKVFDQNILEGVKVNKHSSRKDEVMRVFKITKYNKTKKG